MPATTYLLRKLLDHAFGKTALAMPTHLYLGLSYAAIAKDGSGLSEPAVGSYARVDTVPGDWVAATNTDPTVITNVGTLAFPTATAGYASPVTHWFLADDPTAGNIWWSGALGTPRTIANADTLDFAAGQLNSTAT
jgi:hypothetical protein